MCWILDLKKEKKEQQLQTQLKPWAPYSSLSAVFVRVFVDGSFHNRGQMGHIKRCWTANDHSLKVEIILVRALRSIFLREYADLCTGTQTCTALYTWGSTELKSAGKYQNGHKSIEKGNWPKNDTQFNTNQRTKILELDILYIYSKFHKTNINPLQS